MERERAFCQSSVVEQVLCASLGTVPTRRQCVASADCNTEKDAQTARERLRDAGVSTGVSEAD